MDDSSHKERRRVGLGSEFLGAERRAEWRATLRALGWPSRHCEQSDSAWPLTAVSTPASRIAHGPPGFAVTPGL
jgi:hypothetical protein